MSSLLLFTVVFSIGGTLGVVLIQGIRNWRSTGGKIATLVTGSLLVAMVAFVALTALMATILPGMIALP